MARIGSVPCELSIGLLGSPSYNPLKGYRNRLRFISYSKLGGGFLLSPSFFARCGSASSSQRTRTIVRISNPGFCLVFFCSAAGIK